MRIADNTILDAPGAGIAANKTDYVFIEHNVVRECAHLTRYAGSGISTIYTWSFDGNTDTKEFILRNVCSSNRGDVQWTEYGNSGGNHTVRFHFSDGNGIIVDINRNREKPYPENTLPAYQGRTLVQNNVCYNNGGSGLRTIGAQNVDMVNNTVYQNNQVNKATGVIYDLPYKQTAAYVSANQPATYVKDTSVDATVGNTAATTLNYAEIDAGFGSKNVHMFNNLAWASAGCNINGGFPSQSGGGIVYDHNLFGRDQGGGVNGDELDQPSTNVIPTYSSASVFTSVDSSVSTFLHLQGGSINYSPSPAINKGINIQGTPFLYFDGDYRTLGTTVDIGAFDVVY